MARYLGSIEADDIFGTNRDDVIRGRGGNNFIQANGGDDRISGMGDVEGGRGNDIWSCIDVLRRYPANLWTEVDLGEGRDRVVMTEHDKFSGTTNFGFFNGVDMGSGADVAFFGANAYVSKVYLGLGADTAWIASEQSMYVALGEFAGTREDGQSDVVHIDGQSGGATLSGFEEGDQIVLYNSGLTMREVRLRTTFTFSDETYLTITLKSGAEIEVQKRWDGHLTSDTLKLVEEPFRAETNAMVEDRAALERVVFASGGDDKIKVRDKAVYLNAGDDIGNGTRGDESFHGQAGDDVLRGRAGNDYLTGGLGNDRLIGGGGRDCIDTGAGDDYVNAGRGNDVVTIQRGDKTIKGGGGNDRLIVEDAGYADLDFTLVGGRGADRFVFRDYARNEDRVTIKGFGGRDKVDLRDVIPDTYSANDIDRVYGDFSGREVSVADGWSADGLYLGAFGILFAGLSDGDLSKADFILS